MMLDPLGRNGGFPLLKNMQDLVCLEGFPHLLASTTSPIAMGFAPSRMRLASAKLQEKCERPFGGWYRTVCSTPLLQHFVCVCCRAHYNQHCHFFWTVASRSLRSPDGGAIHLPSDEWRLDTSGARATIGGKRANDCFVKACFAKHCLFPCGGFTDTLFSLAHDFRNDRCVRLSP